MLDPSARIVAGLWMSEMDTVSFIFRSVLKNTCYHSKTRRKVVVDVGANIGLFGLYFASRGCAVHMIEPLAVAALAAQRAAATNKLPLARVHRIAVGTSSGTVKIRFSAHDTSQTHVLRTNPRVPLSWSTAEVPVVSLDAFVYSNRLLAHKQPARRGISLLKVDASGSELDVLKSGSNALKTSVTSVLLKMMSPTTRRKDVAPTLALMHANNFRQSDGRLGTEKNLFLFQKQVRPYFNTTTVV